MAKKVTIKTTKNNSSVAAYLNAIDNEAHRRDGKTLLKLFKQTTGSKASMWGSSIIGFGQYRYQRANGAEIEMLATGYSMRQSGPVLYIMVGHRNYADYLERLGKHKLGKSCVYIKRLADVDLDVLAELIQQGLIDLAEKYEIKI